MTMPERSDSEGPFQGARSQVPGRDRLRAEITANPGKTALPLGASPVPWERGWRVRLPVRAEHVEIEKQVVVRERVVIGRREIEDVKTVSEEVRREELRVGTQGEAQIADPGSVT